MSASSLSASTFSSTSSNSSRHQITLASVLEETLVRPSYVRYMIKCKFPDNCWIRAQLFINLKMDPPVTENELIWRSLESDLNYMTNLSFYNLFLEDDTTTFPETTYTAPSKPTYRDVLSNGKYLPPPKRERKQLSASKRYGFRKRIRADEKENVPEGDHNLGGNRK
jgi:hypothetical protein